MNDQPPQDDFDVVVSSRARIARNLADAPFVHRADEARRRAVVEEVLPSIIAAEASEPTRWIDLESADPLDRRILYEEHMISRTHADASGPRGVAVSSDGCLSVMVNEEDHVRMHVINNGLTLPSCFERIKALDEIMEREVTWAFHSRWGYLAACPTNVGAGIRFSAMLHLPALRLTRELDKVRQAARDLNLAVRGYYGEGSESSGHLYQVSNQITLGMSEAELLEKFLGTIVPGIVDYERAARQALLKRDRVQIEDRLQRDLAILQSARIVKADEAMRRLSMIRLGCSLGLLQHTDLNEITGLFQMIQTGHLQQRAGRPLSQADAQIARAELLRTCLQAA